ncbi:uncharacterized protein ACJ7VT_004138 [Polymixia lowei]
MNLYRSFGNLLETWVTEGVPYSHPQQDNWLGSDYRNAVTISGSPATSKSDMMMNLRSVSEDSGVEMASPYTFLPSPCCSSSTGNTEIDSADREEDRFTPASKPQSPVISVASSTSSLSSSSLSLCPGKTQMRQERSMALHLKVEQALERTVPRWHSLRSDPKFNADDLKQQIHTSSLPRQRNPVTQVKVQRSRSFGPRKTVASLAPSHQTSEPCRRPLSLYRDTPPTKTKPENQREEEKERLSPGLSYLEQVCRMLEEIARLQMRNRGLQMEMVALQDHQGKLAPGSHQCDYKDVAQELHSSQTLEIKDVGHISIETQRLSYNTYQDFRQRSSSDTRILTGHLKKVKLDARGRHASRGDLLEQAEDDSEKQVINKEGNKNKTWKLKIGSLKKGDMTNQSHSQINSQQMHSSEKKTTRHRLSQLFSLRRKMNGPS